MSNLTACGQFAAGHSRLNLNEDEHESDTLNEGGTSPLACMPLMTEQGFDHDHCMWLVGDR